jgi:hypothetical protein
MKIETTQAAFYARHIGIKNFLFGPAIEALTYQGNFSGAAAVLCYFLAFLY